jgi:hypothetical protein
VQIADPETEAWVSLEELTAQALSADPDQPLPPDAAPFVAGGPASAGLLPSWYMPAPGSGTSRRWHGPVVFTIVTSLVLICGLGFCITYGYLVVA